MTSSKKLQLGEFVRVKSFDEILSTVNRDGLNRGLPFSQELVLYMERSRACTAT